MRCKNVLFCLIKNPYIINSIRWHAQTCKSHMCMHRHRCMWYIRYLKVALVKFQCSATKLLSLVSFCQDPNLQTHSLLSAASQPAPHVNHWVSINAWKTYLHMRKETSLTSFFFLSSSFFFFSSRIWAKRCFLRSSSAFRSLLSAIFYVV